MEHFFFRNRLAEIGVELTPEHAKDIRDQFMALSESIQRTLTEYPSYLEDLRNMSEEDRDRWTENLRSRGCDIQPEELDELVEIILRVA